ncbi:hypothetical protein FHY23_000973 [Xanthomonas arboricola]|nr:hypothetical protein [Xanthomonas campestris]
MLMALVSKQRHFMQYQGEFSPARLRDLFHDVYGFD